ncbi:hypothetical protein [Shinella yambaruensis]|uniref:hypothetical protein n=1 Tax=Shinella yambaruensis TaxID=415996 RepID=UPI003CC7F860
MIDAVVQALAHAVCILKYFAPSIRMLAIVSPLQSTMKMHWGTAMSCAALFAAANAANAPEWERTFSSVV